MSTLAALLVHAIDYAGLYPPASLDMTEAVANFAAYTRGSHAWMLGRFVVPANRLEEFKSETGKFGTDLSWNLSVVGSGNIDRDLNAMRKLADVRNVRLDAIELKVAGEQEIADASTSVPKDITLYCEIPISDDAGKLLAAVQKAKRRAKVRTGGVTPEAIPSADSLASFLSACVKHRVPFKATAGLHHPLRSSHRLTYDPDSPAGTMHGFLNVFLAAAWLADGLELETATELLEERSESSLLFTDDEVRWRSRTLPIARIIDTRKNLAISFGSCSFVEPVDELKAIRLL